MNKLSVMTLLFLLTISTDVKCLENNIKDHKFKNSEFNLSNYNGFVILVDMYCCHKCLIMLDSIMNLSEFRKEKTVLISQMLILTPISIRTRMRTFQPLKNIDIFLFTKVIKDSSNIFYKYNIRYTPALLYINNGKMIIFRASTLFGSNYYDLNSVLNIIKKRLNKVKK